MSENVISEKVYTCGNCDAKDTATVFTLPAGWVEIRIQNAEGIHLGTAICGDCRTAVNNALFDRRPVAEKAVPEAPVEETVVEEQPYVASEEEAGEPSKDAIQATVKEMTKQEEAPKPATQQSSRNKRRGGSSQGQVAREEVVSGDIGAPAEVRADAGGHASDDE